MLNIHCSVCACVITGFPGHESHNVSHCPCVYRSHEAPSVKQSRGSGLYSDQSLKQAPLDPADQMLDDSEEQPMQHDPVVVNR